MREHLKNELMMCLNAYVTADVLRQIVPHIETILSNYEIEARKTEIIPYGAILPESVEIYLVTRKIAGLSDKTLYLYHLILADFFQSVQKAPEKVTANDIRVYLYRYQKEHGTSNRTLEGRRIAICAYFKWINAEGYIDKNPTINIDPIKYERKHKKAMSQLDLEKVRLACTTKREKAIVEMLYSTGCRVTELERLNISDVNFETKEVALFGKGDKHRISYLNARAEVALKEYLDTRNDNNEALFIYERKPNGRLRKPGIEAIIRKLMKKTSGVTTHVTPHIFRHTTATTALDRGMDIVDVSKLLGHVKIETTMEYITTNSSAIKNSHQNYIV